MAPSFLFAQDNSSTDTVPLRVKSYYTSDFGFDSVKNAPLNTNLTGFQRFAHHTQHYRFDAHLGVIGSASKEMHFNIGTFKPIWLGLDQYAIYRTPIDSMMHYEVSKPISWIKYAQAPGFEQWVDGFFTRNFGKRLNVGLHYQKIGAQGAYDFQKADSRQFRFFSQWANKKMNHRVFLDAVLYRNSNEENGGVRNDSLFLNPATQPRRGELVRNNTAESRFTTYSLQLSQIRQLGKSYKGNALAAYHKANYTTNKFSYIDKGYPLDSINYYPQKLRIDSITQDSLRFWNLYNELGLTLPNIGGLLKAKAGIYNQTAQYRWLEGSQNINQIGLVFAFNTLIADRIRIAGNANLVLAGHQMGTFNISPEVWLILHKNFTLHGQLNIRRQGASLLSNHFASNHLAWSNNFEPQFINQLQLALQSKWATISTTTTVMQNTIAFDAIGIPSLYATSFAMQQFRLQFWLNWWKFKFIGNTIYQIIPENAPLRLPELQVIGSALIWHTFKGGWEAQAGADLSWQSAFASYGYQPINGQFTLQNTVLAGGFPWVDVFAAIKVKRFRFFAKTENLAQGFAGNGLFTIHRYPHTDRIFKIGLSWLFLN